MPSKLLTDRFVASQSRPRSRQNYFDRKVRGLTLRVTPNGKKSWWFVYRIGGKGSQWLALGGYPGTSLAAARKAAIDHRRDVDHGIDPIAAKKAAETAARQAETEAAEAARAAANVFTFRDMAKTYLAFAKATKRTAHEDEGKVNRHLIPAWGDRPLRSITRADVHELLDKLAGGGMTIGVNRVQALISRIFTVALDRGLVDSHPAARMIKRFAEVARERVLTDDELRTLWTGLGEQPGRAADALRLRVLTGQRGEHEIAPMEWTEVDLDSRLWLIPKARTKNGRPHAVPLGKTAVDILTRRRREAADDEARVFPALTVRSDDHRELATLHGGKYEWKDLRRTVATRLAGLGFDETTIGRTLNHARYTVTGRHYNQHEYLDEKRAALEAWDAELQRILRNEAKESSKVLRHRPRGRRGLPSDFAASAPRGR